MYAYSQATVRFAEGLWASVPLIPQGDIDYHGERFTRLPVEG
ncbi:hypothetical protein [Arthrobacter sp. TB 26]|nr:hypothetical protein [Arthrobacter sp. TB 26]